MKNSLETVDPGFRRSPDGRLPGMNAVLGISLALLTGLVGAGASAASAGTALLWEIGKADNNNTEFSLAPNGYGRFQADGFFVAGKSDPKRDWPYAHPGPQDDWADSRQHTFSVVFGLKSAPGGGQCKLRFDLLDTHGQAPPELGISVNGQEFRQRLPQGGGDASIFGDPSKGKEHKFDLAFPASLLKAGANDLAITTRSGSWILYDWIGLEAPTGLELVEAGGTVVSAIESPPVLVERDGRLMQTVQIAVRHIGEEARATVKLAGADPVPIILRESAQRHEIPMPAVEQETTVEVRVESGGKELASRTVTLKPVRKWVVYLLPHSHVDIGYTHVQTEVEQAQWRYLEMAMDTARKTAGYPAGSRFKWNVEVLWAVDSYLRQATPEQRQGFFEAVRAGQVGLDALYGNMLTGLCSAEELLRAVSFAHKLAQETGVPIESAMITDVPGYTWGIVPAFAHSGLKYFSIGPNGGDRIGLTSAAWGDKPFWWIGPNGRDKVLAWMTGTGYYRVFQSPQRLMKYLDQLEQKGYPYDYVQVRHCLGDNGAPDVNFAEKVKDWNEQHAYPKLVIATTAEMFRNFEKRYGDQLPTAKGDFTPYWEDGAASSALETAMNRASADRLVQAETMFAMGNPQAYPAEDFYQAWRNVILYDEHTWGAHNSISQPDHPFVKSQWAIKQSFALEADKQSRRLLTAANESRGEPPELPAGVQAIDVFKTTATGVPWALVVVPKELSQTGDGLALSPTNKAVGTSQRLTTGELVFRPCCGGFYGRRWYVVPKQDPKTASTGATAEGLTLTTTRSSLARGLTLRLDERTGAIASLVSDGKELVNTNAPTALNDFFYLPGSDLKGLQRNGPVKISVKERGPLIASLLVESEAPGCRKLTREIRLHALRNYVEIVNTVDKAPVRAKEGVHFGFGFNIPDGVVRLDVPWGVVRPEIDQLKGACKNWFTVQRWVDISNDKYGVTLVTPDAPLVEVGGITANLIGGLAGSKLWLEHLEPSQTIYSWAMNNHWHTNYRAEQEGPTVFRYYLFPHGQFKHEDASRFALECTQPMLVLPARGEVPAGAYSYVGYLTVPYSVQVTAYKPSEDGKAKIVRLLGALDKDVEVKLNWGKTVPRAVWLSDASEQPREKAGEKITVPALSIVTLRAEW